MNGLDDLLTRARAMFPLMPSDVFDGWLAGLIPTQGWPFVEIEDSIHVGNWSRMLIGRTLAEWADATWIQAVLGNDLDGVGDPPCISAIMEVAMNFMQPADSHVGWHISKSRQRVGSAREHILQHGSIPGFITVARVRHGRLHVVDGNHRIAACWTLGEVAQSIRVPAWIADL